MSDSNSSLWKNAWIRLCKNKLATASLFLVVAILLLCFVVRWLLPNDPNVQDLSLKFSEPNGTYWLGGDQLGRDLLVRILDGGQISLIVAIVATLLTVVTGVFYGSIAGYIGGLTETIMMRVVDALLAMPFLIIVILLREVIEQPIGELSQFLISDWGWNSETVIRFSNIVPLILAIAAFGWLTMGRIVRSQAANLVKMEYVEAARSLGLSHFTILTRHVIPNLMGTVIVYSTLTIPSFILYEATLSFIGLGIEPPNASWGMLIKDGANLIETQPALLIFPSIIFSLTLFGFNFLGDGLRDALDPKSAKD